MWGPSGQQGGVSLLTRPVTSFRRTRLAGWPNFRWLWQNRCDGGGRDGCSRHCAGWRTPSPSWRPAWWSSRCPAAAATLPPGLSYRLELEGLGAWTVSPNGGPRRGHGGPHRRRSQWRGLRDLDRPGDARAAGLRPQPARRAGARPPASSAAAAARRSRSAGSPPTRARATWPGSACRSTPTWSSARSPTRSSRSGPAATASPSPTSWSARAAAPGGSRSTTARSASSAALGESPDALVRIRYSDWLRLLSGEITPSDAMRLG